MENLNAITAAAITAAADMTEARNALIARGITLADCKQNFLFSTYDDFSGRERKFYDSWFIAIAAALLRADAETIDYLVEKADEDGDITVNALIEDEEEGYYADVGVGGDNGLWTPFPAVKTIDEWFDLVMHDVESA